MINNSKEYILCSAILKEIEPNELPIYKSVKNDIHKCCLGFRHADILYNFKGIVSKHPLKQGFYTSKGRFVDRKEAMQIALNAEQVEFKNLGNPLIGLFSEDIY